MSEIGLDLHRIQFFQRVLSNKMLALIKQPTFEVRCILECLTPLTKMVSFAKKTSEDAKMLSKRKMNYISICVTFLFYFNLLDSDCVLRDTYTQVILSTMRSR